MVHYHLQKVRAFPGGQRVHADPSCLSLPCLQQLPSHHGCQQVPTAYTECKVSNIMWIDKDSVFMQARKSICILDGEQTTSLSIMFIQLYCTYSDTSSSSGSNRTSGTSWALKKRKDKEKRSVRQTDDCTQQIFIIGDCQLSD